MPSTYTYKPGLSGPSFSVLVLLVDTALFRESRADSDLTPQILSHTFYLTALACLRQTRSFYFMLLDPCTYRFISVLELYKVVWGLFGSSFSRMCHPENRTQPLYHETTHRNKDFQTHKFGVLVVLDDVALFRGSRADSKLPPQISSCTFFFCVTACHRQTSLCFTLSASCTTETRLTVAQLGSVTVWSLYKAV